MRCCTARSAAMSRWARRRFRPTGASAESSPAAPGVTEVPPDCHPVQRLAPPNLQSVACLEDARGAAPTLIRMTKISDGPQGQGVGSDHGTTTRRRWWVGGTIATLAVAGALLALAPRLSGSKDNQKPVVALEFLPAEVVRPALAAMPLRIEFSGPLVAPRTAVVRAKAAGPLMSLAVGESARVKAGQPLGAIDLADLRSRVADRAAAVEAAQVARQEAERQHAANVGLASQSFISSTALQSSQARLDAARAQLKSAQAPLASSQVGMREAALVAPLARLVGKRHVVPGEKVSAEQPLFTVVDLTTLELAGTVGTHEVSRLAPGLGVQVRV